MESCVKKQERSVRRARRFRPTREQENRGRTTDLKGEQATSRYAAVFSEYKSELDARHDKHERLVKLSRDITIHSKRAIFLLHRVASERVDSERDQLLDKVEEKFKEVQQYLKTTAEELHGTDPWLHSSAYSPGLQEFIEALSYYVLLKQGQLLSMEEALHWLRFPARLDTDKEEELVRVPLSGLNYVLGVADLTGELMRMCITAVGAGQQEIPFQLLPFIHSIYCGFHSLLPISREISHKLRTLHSSMAKVETACYTLQIRGSEIPQHMLSDVFHEDEGVENSEHFDD